MSDAGEGGATSNAINGGFFFNTVIQGRDITVQLPPTITPALGGLEAPSLAFTGRTTDLEAVLKVLAPGGSLDGGPQAVLVSAVSGMAGVGKTELAKKAGAEAWKERGWFSGGVLFTDLAGYDPERRLTPERALEGLLRALAIPGEHIPNGLEDRQRLYRSVLAAYAKESRRILVIIDNASTADQVSPLLPADGINAALVTSRHTLAIGARLHDMNVMETTEAVEMLGAELRVARGDGDTRITQALGQAAKIADLCAYLPLALNIAASLLAENDTVAEDGTMDYTAADLASDLEAEHTRLDELSYEERAVRAAFDLSYRRLDQQQARLFRLLPLNPGPSISSEATAHLADLEERNARHLLTRLARAHLIERRSGRRWAMHDLVRLYADEHGRTHSTGDQRHSARIRLFTHYQDTAEAANTHLATSPGPRAPHFPDRAAALQWLDAEHASLTATATAAPALGHPATTSSLAFSLARYFDYRRYFDDWITLTTTTLAICHELGDRHSEGQALNNLGLALRKVRRFEEAIDAHTQATDIARELRDRHNEGAALNDLGSALREVRRFEEAIDAHTQATDIARELRDRHGESTALSNLGLALMEVRRFEEAIDAHTQATTVFRELRDRHRESTALSNLGLALMEVRRFEEAIDAHTQSADIARELGDRHGEGAALSNLGLALMEVRRFEEAIDANTQATTVFRELGDRHGEGAALSNLGLALMEVRRLEEAIDAHTQATDIARELRDRHREGETLNNLGLALMEVRRLEEAIDAHTQATTVFRELGDRHGEGAALSSLGLALRHVQRFEEAIEAHTQATTVFRELRDRHREGQTLYNLGLALMEVRRFEEAIDANTQATTVFRELGDRHSEGQTLNNLGLALRHVQRFEEAIEAHTQAADIARELGDRHGEGAALSNLGLALMEVRRFEEAIDANTQATTVFRELGDRHREGQTLNNLGLALMEVRRFEEAIEAHTQATTVYRELGDRHRESTARTAWAVTHNQRWLRRS